MRFEIIDHGVEHSQYFPGCDSDTFDYVITGIGENFEEAFEDCLEQMANFGFDVSPLEAEVGEQLASAYAKGVDFYYHVSIRFSS